MGDIDVTSTVLAVTGVATFTLIAVKNFVDQLPDMFRSIGKARKAWKQLVNGTDETPQPEETAEERPRALAPPADDEEPPAAA
ncbi:hypothetical protein [Streptomyces griseus]|uniref:hypothetical protein n=1 Tax=Streptomyces griseus TaxID=1911 RepID=UPI00365B8323